MRREDAKAQFTLGGPARPPAPPFPLPRHGAGAGTRLSSPGPLPATSRTPRSAPPPSAGFSSAPPVGGAGGAGGCPLRPRPRSRRPGRAGAAGPASGSAAGPFPAEAAFQRRAAAEVESPRLRPASLRPGVAAASWNCPSPYASGSPVPLPASAPTAFPPANGPSYQTPSAQITAVTAPSGQTPRDTRTPPGSIQAAGPCKGLLRDAGAQRLLCQCPPCPSGKGPSSRSVHLLARRQDVSLVKTVPSPQALGLALRMRHPFLIFLNNLGGFFSNNHHQEWLSEFRQPLSGAAKASTSNSANIHTRQ